MNHQALITFITSLTLWACRSARENGTSNKGPPQPQPPSVHSKCENLSNYGFYKILLTFHLLSFSHSRPPPLQNTPAWSSSALPISWPSSRRNSGELNNLIPTLHPHLSLCLPVLLLTQQGLLGSRQTGVILLSATPSYPGRGLGSTETVRARSWGHKAQINRDER